MYRLTVSGPFVNTFHAKHSGKPRTTLRVYKWGDATGQFAVGAPKWDSAWIAETRTPVAHGSTAILESVTPLACDAPPPTVDDLWEEEVVLAGPVIAGNTLSIAGNETTLQEFVRNAGISLPTAVAEALTLLHRSKVLAPTEAPPEAPPEAPSTPGTAPEARSSLPVPRADLQPPRLLGAQPPQSGHGPVRHPGPHGSPRGERRPLNHVQYSAPRPEHTGPRPYVPRAGPGPAFRNPNPPQPGQRLPGPAHGAGGPPRYEQRRTGPKPPSRGCLVVEE
jgi:hypothetical protein